MKSAQNFDLPRDAFLTTAIYQLDRTNTRATDPNDPTRILQTGRQRSEGLEIGLNGTVTKWWTGLFGYAYQDAYITSSTTALARAQPWRRCPSTLSRCGISFN